MIYSLDLCNISKARFGAVFVQKLCNIVLLIDVLVFEYFSIVVLGYMWCVFECVATAFLGVIINDDDDDGGGDDISVMRRRQRFVGGGRSLHSNLLGHR